MRHAPPSSFADHFSGHAEDYARARPRYPAELFAALSDRIVGPRRMAWDCATGNGQAAAALTAYFDRVVATDASTEQLQHATLHPRVTYRCAPAEASGLEAGTVDAVTVAAAVHWFDLDRFYAEVRRVARPGAILAVWTYRPQHIQVTPAVDALVEDFATRTLAPYWAPELVRYVDAAYASLPFPFPEVPFPTFSSTVSWSSDQFVDHLRTWSGTQAYRRATGNDPVAGLQPELAAAWGDPTHARNVRFPLHVRVGRV